VPYKFPISIYRYLLIYRDVGTTSATLQAREWNESHQIIHQKVSKESC